MDVVEYEQTMMEISEISSILHVALRKITNAVADFIYLIAVEKGYVEHMREKNYTEKFFLDWNNQILI